MPCGRLQVLDDSVEQLTVGLKNTLGSLWGGARGVLQSGIAPIAKMAEKVEEAAVLAAKELVETVEEGVADVRGLSVVKAATSAAANTRKLGGMLAAKAESSIEVGLVSTFEPVMLQQIQEPICTCALSAYLVHLYPYALSHSTASIDVNIQHMASS